MLAGSDRALREGCAAPDPKGSVSVEYRQLGTSGLVVSRVSYGNSTTAGNQLDDSRSAECVHAALDAGITTFDTADGYSAGRAEEALGKALKAERRDSLVITSKVFFPTGKGPNDRGLSRKHIRSAVEGSLRRLGTDYLDVYVAHRYDARVPLTETMSAFADLVRAGKVLYLGVSDWEPEQVVRAKGLADGLGVQLICSQAQYSMLWRIPEAGLAQTCEALGLGQFAWSPLAGGVLTGKYLPGAAAPEDSRVAEAQGAMEAMNRWYRMGPEVLARVQELKAVAADAGLSMSQLALSWVLHHRNQDSVVIGASRPAQIAANLAVLERALDSEVLARIDDVLGPVVVRDPALDPQPS